MRKRLLLSIFPFVLAAQANASGEIRPIARPEQVREASDADAAAIFAEVYTDINGLPVQIWNKPGDNTWYIMLETQPK